MGGRDARVNSGGADHLHAAPGRAPSPDSGSQFRRDQAMREYAAPMLRLSLKFEVVIKKTVQALVDAINFSLNRL